jgi:hypothetical protein
LFAIGTAAAALHVVDHQVDAHILAVLAGIHQHRALVRRPSYKIVSRSLIFALTTFPASVSITLTMVAFKLKPKVAQDCLTMVEVEGEVSLELKSHLTMKVVPKLLQK